MIQNEAALINAGLQIGLYDRELVNRLRGMARVNRVPVRFAIFGLSSFCLLALSLLAVIATLG